MDNNYCIILAGGIGSRFWPYSRKRRPKQFLDFFGTGESLLQQTYRRYAPVFAKGHIYVVTNTRYETFVREQLPDLPPESILLEPIQRNTAAAIAYAAKHIHAVNPDAVLAIAPSDHLVTKEQIFAERIRQALELAATKETIVTLGIKPTYPEVGYGYIQATAPNGSDDLREGHFYPVKTFTEKPNMHMAKVLVDSGEFFWNSGIFIGQCSHFLHELEVNMPELTERLFQDNSVWNTDREADYISERYPYCPSISFDYAVMEKSQNAVMLLCDIGWADVGSWNTIYTLTEHDADRNATIGTTPTIYNDSSGNLVVLDKPDGLVVLQGVNDLIVVQKDDVLVICRKSEGEKLKQVIPEATNLDEKFVD